MSKTTQAKTMTDTNTLKGAKAIIIPCGMESKFNAHWHFCAVLITKNDPEEYGDTRFRKIGKRGNPLAFRKGNAFGIMTNEIGRSVLLVEIDRDVKELMREIRVAFEKGNLVDGLKMRLSHLNLLSNDG